ncbi:MAG: tyrosine-type recombinase/integrase [Caldilineales bacterium]|nr:tyrosine-type recombinase/integrase [Caldilineales bacterium]MCX7853749.1 tyrosine-type recombinase/integrase [Caldilineales bacterium]
MDQQLELFDTPAPPGRPRRSVPIAPMATELTPDSTVTAALGPYHRYLLGAGFSDNTITAFLGDIRLLVRFLQEKGKSAHLRDIGVDTLNEFLYWLRFERLDDAGNPVPCRPKSYARRVTALKSFFGWLAATEVLARDPAAPLIQESAQAPLPRILTDAEVERLLRVTRDLLWSPSKPDARPHLLVLLLLQTGLKKSEVMNLRLSDIDTSNPREPLLTVRYEDGRHAHKERTLFLGPDFLPVYNQYLRSYKPRERLFECTARNLEYVLAEAAALAEIKDGVSFEMMRWTSAVRAYRFGAAPEALRQKLGLSPISWRETFEKIQKLARPIR